MLHVYLILANVCGTMKKVLNNQKMTQLVLYLLGRDYWRWESYNLVKAGKDVIIFILKQEKHISTCEKRLTKSNVEIGSYKRNGTSNCS